MPRLFSERPGRELTGLRAALDAYVEKRSSEPLPSLSALKTRLYPYQEEGVRFGLYRKAALIGDEMGLGKTLQGIALAILKDQSYVNGFVERLREAGLK